MEFRPGAMGRIRRCPGGAAGGAAARLSPPQAIRAIAAQYGGPRHHGPILLGPHGRLHHRRAGGIGPPAMTVGNWFAKLASAYSGIQGENQRAGELLRRGAEHQNAGNSGAAEECYRQLLSLQPENAEARHRLARILAATGSASQERGELGAAIEGYEEALALEQGQAGGAKKPCHGLRGPWGVAG